MPNRADRRAVLARARLSERRGAWGDWEEVAIPPGTRSQYGVPGLWRAFRNAVFSVQVYPRRCEWGEVLHLMVRRHDAAAVRSWHDLQRIKSTLPVAGPDRVAVEVYPRDDELVDDANIYHLWLLPAEMVLPFGLRRGAT